MDENTQQAINEIWDDFQQTSITVEGPSIKRRAVRYLRKKIFGKLTRRDMRKLSAKIYKMKNSIEKSERARDDKLEKVLQRTINSE